MKKNKIIGRIKYYKDFYGTEGYAFEIYQGEESWGLDTFYPLDENDKLSYQALTKIREWQVFEVDFHFE